MSEKKERRRNSSSQTRGQFVSGSRSILIIVLTVIVIAAVIGALVLKLRPSSGKHSSGTDIETAESSISVVQQQNDLEHNKYPEVNALIENYRKAFLENNADLLKKVYNTTQDVNENILKGTAEIIESYDDTQYYTKNGLRSGEYVAFVYDKIHIRDVDTPAPNLSVFYIKTADDKSLYIYRGEYNASTGTYEYDSDVQKYIESLYEDQDVKDLIDTVNTELNSACAKDPDLQKFIDKLRDRNNITSVGNETELSSESEAESALDESESETASAQEEQ